MGNFTRTLHEIFINSTVGMELTAASIASILLFALACGFIVSIGYILANKAQGYARDFAITILIMPIIIACIIMMVGSNIAKAFTLSGAFAIVRFRSAPGGPKDIMYIALTMALGLACGVGYIYVGIILSILVSLLAIILAKTNYAAPSNTSMILKITIPEDLNYEGAFDEIFEKYATASELKKVRTSEFGSLFQLIYQIEVRKGINQKEFIDELRCHNGNLNISLSLLEYDEKTFA